MANLPDKAFMFNYNAREYDAVNYTFPKTQGQIFDEDIVLNKAPASYTDEYVDFGSSKAYMGKGYSSTNNNPMNRSSSIGNSFTFVYKTGDYTSGGNLFANRSPSTYNYMVRATVFHTSNTSFLNLTPSTNPQICVIRIQSNGQAERMFIDGDGNVLQRTTASTTSWGNTTNGFAFFAGYSNGNEEFNHKFYWMYCSLEVLTDAEILQVVKFNEQKGVSITPDTGDFAAAGGTATVAVESETPWSAATTDSWISFTPTSGDSGTTSVVVSVAKTNFESRTGKITFTDAEENEAEYIAGQTGNENKVPWKKAYRGTRRIN